VRLSFSSHCQRLEGVFFSAFLLTTRIFADVDENFEIEK
jgi:hypothetical protein